VFWLVTGWAGEMVFQKENDQLRGKKQFTKETEGGQEEG
jgi:hypothetical protein